GGARGYRSRDDSGGKGRGRFGITRPGGGTRSFLLLRVQARELALGSEVDGERVGRVPHDGTVREGEGFVLLLAVDQGERLERAARRDRLHDGLPRAGHVLGELGGQLR